MKKAMICTRTYNRKVCGAPAKYMVSVARKVGAKTRAGFGARVVQRMEPHCADCMVELDLKLRREVKRVQANLARFQAKRVRLR